MPVTRFFPSLRRSDPLDARMVEKVVNSIREGKLNCKIEVTLADGAAFTVVEHRLINMESNLHFTALSASAAAIQGSIWYSEQTDGSVKINHSNVADLDMVGRLTVIG